MFVKILNNRQMNRILLLIGILITQLSNAQTPGSGVTIDGYTYPTVIINGREWMAENLKATHYESGSSFFSPGNINQFATAPITNYFATGPWATPAVTDTQLGSGDGYGKLYNASVIYNPSQVIKTGWRVPTKAEWQSLITYTSGENLRKVEAVSGTNYWTCTGNFIDQYGFGAIATGRIVIDGSTASFQDLGTGAFFWCVSDYPAQEGQENINYARIVCSLTTPSSSDGILSVDWTTNRKSALSVRLIKDAPLSNDSFDKSKVLIYPNPVKTELTINSPETIKGIEIFDLLGKSIYQKSNTGNTINIDFLQKGIYILKVNTEKGSSNYKIMKK